MEIIFKLDEIESVAKQIWEEGKQYKQWVFYAEMGSGKTTLIHALCTYLEVDGSVSSPTYAIINEYKSKVVGTIYHHDWYRLKDEEEAINAGVEDALLNGNLSLIEWPEKAAGLLEEAIFKITITVVDEATRKVSFNS
jgi:tRNA threonylcarbamoyladenosine biosynthesis protein TsaE